MNRIAQVGNLLFSAVFILSVGIFAGYGCAE